MQSGIATGPYTVFTVGASVQYEVDMFGRVGRLVEPTRALAISEAARIVDANRPP